MGIGRPARPMQYCEEESGERRAESGSYPHTHFTSCTGCVVCGHTQEIELYLDAAVRPLSCVFVCYSYSVVGMAPLSSGRV